MSRPGLRQIIYLVLLAAFVAACSTRATPVSDPNSPSFFASFVRTASLNSAMETKIDAAVEQMMKTNQIPGLAIGIIKDRQIVYSKGFGLANVKTGQAVTAGTVFQLGSVSKMMVGIATMQLSEQGKIDLDAPVTTYLPYFHMADERYKQITIRQILTHRSGLPYCSVDDPCDSQDFLTPEYDDDSLERHVRNLPTAKLNNAPGKEMEYSDLAFEILGDVIAKVSGQSFEAYMQQHIFAPLGMQHTSFMLRDIPTGFLAAPHVQNPNLAVNDFFPYTRQHAPSSHLFSNVEDMNRYALAILNRNQLSTLLSLSETTFDQMWTATVETNMPSPWEKMLGLGWFLGGQTPHRLVGHAGGDVGFACDFIMAPDDGLAVVVMVNREYYVEELSYQVIEWLLEANLQVRR